MRGDKKPHRLQLEGNLQPELGPSGEFWRANGSLGLPPLRQRPPSSQCKGYPQAYVDSKSLPALHLGRQNVPVAQGLPPEENF